MSDDLRRARDEGEVELVTRTDFTFRVRTVQPEDEAVLAEFFTHVTPEDLRFRFLSAIDHVGHAQLAPMTVFDHSRTENFLALGVDGRTIIATAMLSADADMQRGEVAISIRRDFKQRGIGWTLLDHVARYAEARGMRQIESIEHRDNHAAINLEKELGFVSEPISGDPTLLLVRRVFE